MRRRVVEELESDDAGSQGGGLVRTPGRRRLISDEFRFTGTDMGGGRVRDRYAYQGSDDDDDDNDSESNSEATTDDDTEDEARSELENALVQSALARIRKAQAKGKQDVKLNKEELAALERRRKRLQAEADKKRGKDNRRQKEREQRVAVPLSQFDLPVSATVPPAGVSSSSQRQGSSSPFDYQYVSPSSNKRHASDTPRSNLSLSNVTRGEDRRPQASPSHHSPDPFQFQTDGPRARYPTGATAYGSMSRGGAPPTAKSSLGETRENDIGSDEHGNGARIGQGRSQDNGTVPTAGSSPESEHGRSRTTRARSRNASPGKRKPVGTGSRRRKAK
ncbi:hypothetical protein GGR50DRAFT_478316 [Xylaria sp. CBS 124048]|nr:hypothetical protein GGR50DRAFT_478316 [Xylaria sp. CBS 124048]